MKEIPIDVRFESIKVVDVIAISRPLAFLMLHDAFINPIRGYVQSASAQMLDNAADPFKAMVKISKAREVDAFGAGFTFERERDDDRAYLVNVKRCFYHNFFAANGAAELTPIFCDFDANWITAINPVRHGFHFARPTTIGYGGMMCPCAFPTTLYTALTFLKELPRDEVLASVESLIPQLEQEIETWNQGEVVKNDLVSLPLYVQAMFANGREHLEADLHMLYRLQELLSQT